MCLLLISIFRVSINLPAIEMLNVGSELDLNPILRNIVRSEGNPVWNEGKQLEPGWVICDKESLESMLLSGIEERMNMLRLWDVESFGIFDATEMLRKEKNVGDEAKDVPDFEAAKSKLLDTVKYIVNNLKLQKRNQLSISIIISDVDGLQSKLADLISTILCQIYELKGDMFVKLNILTSSSEQYIRSLTGETVDEPGAVYHDICREIVKALGRVDVQFELRMFFINLSSHYFLKIPVLNCITNEFDPDRGAIFTLNPVCSDFFPLLLTKLRENQPSLRAATLEKLNVNQDLDVVTKRNIKQVAFTLLNFLERQNFSVKENIFSIGFTSKLIGNILYNRYPDFNNLFVGKEAQKQDVLLLVDKTQDLLTPLSDPSLEVDNSFLMRILSTNSGDVNSFENQILCFLLTEALWNMHDKEKILEKARKFIHKLDEDVSTVTGMKPPPLIPKIQTVVKQFETILRDNEELMEREGSKRSPKFLHLTTQLSNLSSLEAELDIEHFSRFAEAVEASENLLTRSEYCLILFRLLLVLNFRFLDSESAHLDVQTESLKAKLIRKVVDLVNELAKSKSTQQSSKEEKGTELERDNSGGKANEEKSSSLSNDPLINLISSLSLSEALQQPRNNSASLSFHSQTSKSYLVDLLRELKQLSTGSNLLEKLLQVLFPDSNNEGDTSRIDAFERLGISHCKDSNNLSLSGALGLNSMFATFGALKTPARESSAQKLLKAIEKQKHSLHDSSGRIIIFFVGGLCVKEIKQLKTCLQSKFGSGDATNAGSILLGATRICTNESICQNLYPKSKRAIANLF